ncbi:MAG TPA: methyltransferase [Caulobacteraceae bacterium]|jgi:predicted methyltransferase|nr:methyltransferase [Caulobacteraceae bacterium]
MTHAFTAVRRLALGLVFTAIAAVPALAQDPSLRNAPRAPAPSFTEDQALTALIAGPRRTPANTARDAWRHPLESLTFWGLQPGLTVLEIDPAGGYWTEILAPYAARTGGRYIAAGLPHADDPAVSEGARKARAAFEAKVTDHGLYGDVTYADFSAVAGLAAPPASVDLILTARNIHNWMWTPGAVDRDFASFAAALKPGGILAVEEHRADPRPMIPEARDGYVSEDYVIAAAKRAGLVFEARSDVNANPKDSKNHPFGVWTLPPTRRSAPSGQPANPSFDHARYDAIGESDRMTLRFRKPD